MFTKIIVKNTYKDIFVVLQYYPDLFKYLKVIEIKYSVVNFNTLKNVKNVILKFHNLVPWVLL